MINHCITRTASRAFSLLGFCLLASCASIRQASPPGEPGHADVSGYTVVPLARGSQNHIFVKTRINSLASALLVDTGSPVTCIDDSKRRRFGLQPFAGSDSVPSQVIANGELRDVTIVRAVQFGAMELVDVPAVLIDMREVNQRFSSGRGNSGDGILGADLLLSRKAVVDYPGLRLYLRFGSAKRGDLATRLKANGWQECDMKIDQGHLVVDGAADGAALRFIVDTGAFGTAFDRSFCKARGMKLVTAKNLHSGGIGYREKTTQVTDVKRLRIGDFELRNYSVGAIGLFALFGDRPKSGRPVAALLGADILGAHKAVIDCEAMKLYLKP